MTGHLSLLFQVNACASCASTMTCVIASTCVDDHKSPMDQTIEEITLGVLKRAPQWVRHDLGTKDAAVRERAEETLAAMIASALKDGAVGK